MIVVLFVRRFRSPRSCRSGGGCSPCSSALLVVSDIAHAIAYEIPRPGSERHQGVPVPRRQLRVDRGVDRGGPHDRRVGAAPHRGAVRRRVRRLARRAHRWRDRSLRAVEVAAARRRSRVAHARRGRARARARGGSRRRRARAHGSQPRARRRPSADGQWLSLLVAGLSDAELARIVPRARRRRGARGGAARARGPRRARCRRVRGRRARVRRRRSEDPTPAIRVVVDRRRERRRDAHAARDARPRRRRPRPRSALRSR